MNEIRLMFWAERDGMPISQEDFRGLSQESLIGITSRCVARVLPILGYWAERNASRLAWVDFAEGYLSKIQPSDKPADDQNLLGDHLAYQTYYLASKAVRVLGSTSHAAQTKESTLAAETACAYVAEALETLSQLLHDEMPQDSRKVAKLRSRFSYELDNAVGTPRDGKNVTPFDESIRDDVLNWRAGMNWKAFLWKTEPPAWYTAGKQKIAHPRVNGS